MDNLASTCTDSGTGTEAAPFCSIQLAANVATAGDAVLIAGTLQGGGNYSVTPGMPYAAGITIRNPGTASAPTVFKAEGGPYEISGGDDGITILGDHVDISGEDVVGASLAGYWMGGTYDVLDGDQADAPGDPVYSDIGSNLTVKRSFLTTSGGEVVVLSNGGSGSVVTTNVLVAQNVGHGKNYALLAVGGSGLDITGNTISVRGGGAAGIGVMNGASDVVVENNVVSYIGCTGVAGDPRHADHRVG